MCRSKPLGLFPALVAIALVTEGRTSKAAGESPILKIQIVADDIRCKGCAQKVAAQLYTAPGVTSVDTDVPNRLVRVTAKSSPKFTLERLWLAVEQTGLGPSKLIAPQATYVLTRPANLKPEQRMPPGRYSLVVRTMKEQESARQITDQLDRVHGVQRVRVDLAQQALFVESAGGAVLSPWTLASAVESAQHEPIAVYGPHGLLTIERPAKTASGTAAHSTHSQAE